MGGPKMKGEWPREYWYEGWAVESTTTCPCFPSVGGAFLSAETDPVRAFLSAVTDPVRAFLSADTDPVRAFLSAVTDPVRAFLSAVTDPVSGRGLPVSRDGSRPGLPVSRHGSRPGLPTAGGTAVPVSRQRTAMADLEREVEALPGLAAELTCAICLELLQEPVTAPCGHNFCRDCLSLYWADDRVGLNGFSCPQCRCHWAQRPELRPNRVLCTVVAGLERARCNAETVGKAEVESGLTVPCDACPPAAAAAALRSCLTCLASFCAEHLEPHQQSPALRSHSLRLPLPDLAERRCPSHGKLLEFRCCQHGDCLCAVCLLDHRSCSTVTEEEAREKHEEELKVQQKTVEYQLIQLQHSLELVQFQKEHVKDSSMTQKSAVAYEFAEMKAMIEQEEKIAARLFEEEENKADSRCVELLDQMSAHLERLKDYKEQLKSVLTHTGGIAFWKVVADLPKVSLDPPTSQQQVEVDAHKLVLISKAVSTLRGKLGQQLKFSLDQRVRQLEQIERANSKLQTAATDLTKSPEKSKNKIQDLRQILVSDQLEIPGDPQPLFFGTREPPEVGKPSEDKPGRTRKSKPKPSATPRQTSDETEKHRRPSNPSSASVPQTRQDYMQYNSKVTFNQRSAHKKLILSDRYTTLTVGEQLQSYPDLPERFFNCSQVLALQCFTNGRHYWEVGIQGSSSSFWAIGVACAGMDRSGSSSRLGRNALSWCIESFGAQLSIWHADQQAVLHVPLPRVVGVYLDFEAGEVAFFSVGSGMFLLFRFKANLRGQVFPAFWLSSSSTKLTLGH
ncbi:E3 ubiquitin/ISG15 ligase TRIM25 isoform X2 [Hypanus sabinus]|uniref:E3 ubiquitin/ISG15 ligase TRIM25 isoform X2 n=1 Tax=Hypanus sabinus TaxID=79690 RepID=UPI0028C3EAF6|nr:E3 ubiquitin/ISG15 ligase TRIM25 isoform X2 [Hypanus sabinus]